MDFDWPEKKPYVPIDYVDSLKVQLATLTAEHERLQAEVNAVDAALARRPALDGAPNRATAIERACARAGQADKAEAERERLTRENAELEAIVTRLTDERDALAARLSALEQAHKA